MADAWLKTFRKGNRLSPHQSPDDLGALGDEREFLESLSTYPDGSPKLTKHGEPLGRPNYEIGSLIVTYWNGTYEVRDVWEVVDEPERSDATGRRRRRFPCDAGPVRLSHHEHGQKPRLV
jgi:hypothetical protein